MDVVTLIFILVSFVFHHAQSCDECQSGCSEFLRLNHRTNEDVVEVRFSNRTLPGHHTFLLWQWITRDGNSWNISLWLSHQEDRLLGNAILMNPNKLELVNFKWKLHNATLEWSYNGTESHESNWTISLCQIAADWSFTRNIYGRMFFQLGDMELYRPQGKMNISIDKFSEKVVKLRNSPQPEISDIADNQILLGALINKKYHRLERSSVDKENFAHSNATPAEKWEIVQAILDRVFGNSEDIRRNGWVSHLNIFNILGRIFGLDQLFGSRSVAPTTTESSATEPDAETVNTNFLRRFPGARLK